MALTRIAIILAGLMCAASVGAIVVRPSAKAAERGQGIVLENVVPKKFGDWQELPQQVTQVINPQTKELLDKLYSQMLSRTYVNSAGYRVMLSLAYGDDQRGALQAHKPEVCYPAQGFALKSNSESQLATEFGTIPVRRLFTTLGPRQEPVTYWFTVGDRAIKSTVEKRLVEMRLALTGQIPDGMLFRVSSIDGDTANAYRMQDEFVKALLQAVPPVDRVRLSGLGAATVN